MYDGTHNYYVNDLINNLFNYSKSVMFTLVLKSIEGTKNKH